MYCMHSEREYSSNSLAIVKGLQQLQLRNVQGVSKKLQALNIHECSLRFEQQKVYVALGFEPLASITGLNIELLLCGISSLW